MSKRCLGCMELFGDEFEICPHCGYIVGTRAEEAIHIEPGTLLYDRYIIGKVLGYGGFGVTYLGWDGKLEQKVAIKEYLPGEFSTRMPGQSQVTVFNGEKNEQFHDGLRKFVEEAKRLAKFQNEQGIVKIFDSFEENDTAYIIMEYLDGETLTEYLRREKTIPEDVAVAMLMPVMESLQAVHDEGLLHRDIAPDNIFLTKSGEVKLIDFGASRYATTSHSRSLTVIIKPGYSPEEQYRSRGDQGPHTDVYAIAATLYKMITGKTPPDAMERRAKYENQNKDILEEPHKINKKISLNRENAILNAMNVRVEDRTPDIATFIKDINADPPVKRIYGKIKKIDLYAWPLWLKILVPSLLSVILVFGALLLTGVIKFSNFTEEIVIPDNIVTVPDVEGLYKDEALKLITDGQLLASTDGSVESEYIPAGKIILQTPVGGSYMDINGTVLLMISSGKGVDSPENGISTVPYVIWDDKELAVSKLKQAGLAEPDIVEKHDESVAYGSVISQSVEAGTQVDEGTKITLTISIGPAAFTMPDVVGQSKDKAESTLNSKGLVVVIEYKKTDEVAEGNVISQSVSAGSSAKRGDVITITVSSGRETIDVANVVGMTRSAAEKALKDQGFKVTVLENYDSNVAAGKVISQSPGAGTAQLPGATIVIYVSKGKQPITVTYDANGGTVSPGSKSGYLSDTYGALPTPTRTGYSFVGWYSAKSGGVKVSADTTITTPSNHSLYAIWKANEYFVSFDATGGTSPVSIKVIYNAKYSTLPTTSRTGYTFVGWYTAASGGTKITEDSTYSTASNQTLYAQWKPNTYTITFDANGGQVSPNKKTVTYGATYGTLPIPTKTGYTFVEWHALKQGASDFILKENDTVKITSNITAAPIWKPKEYTVSWNTGTGYTITVERVSSASGYGSSGKLSNGSKVYYGDVLSVRYSANTGYSLNSKGSTSITVTGNITSSVIYASAKANNYTYNIVYKSINGTQLGSATATYSYGTTNTISPKSFPGYSTPPSRSVQWDSTSAKTITFTYTPGGVTNSTKTGTISSSPRMTYSVNVEYQNRTASSVQIRISWTTTIEAGGWNTYGQKFNASVGSVSTGEVQVTAFGAWKNSSSSVRSSTGTSGWITVPLSTTNATSVSLGVYYYQTNSNNTDMTRYYSVPGVNQTWTVNIPAY